TTKETSTCLPLHWMIATATFKSMPYLFQPFNIGLYSISNPPLYYVMGEMNPIEAPDISLPQNAYFKIKADKDTLSLLPERRVINNSVLLFLHNQVSPAANYKLTPGDSLLEGLSFNYNRKESDMSFISPTDLEKT